MNNLKLLTLVGVLAVAFIASTNAQEARPFDVVRQILNTENIFSRETEPVCPGCSDEEAGEITINCCECMEDLEVVEILGLEVCVNSTWIVDADVFREVITDVIREEGVDVEDVEEVAAAIKEFSIQAVDLSDFDVEESGSLPIISRQRDIDRELQIKAKYNDKTKDMALGMKRDKDFIANTQLGPLEKRAGKLSEATATTVLDRNAHTGRVKNVESDIHKDTVIDIAAMGFRPSLDAESLATTAGSFVRPFLGSISNGLGDVITGK